MALPSLYTSEGLLCGGRSKRRRVLRGGSFNNTADNARCAYRNRNNPNNLNRNNGFRVCCVFHVCLRWPEMPPGYWLGGRGIERWLTASLAELAFTRKAEARG